MDPSELTALEQAAAIKRGELTAVELTEGHLERCEQWGDVVGAFATVTPDLALRDAARVDARLQRGEGRDLPLIGCAAPVKDLDPVAGVRSTFGSRAFVHTPPDQVDADFVARMRSAGLVITGKTNTPEFGLPCYTENDVFPAARTPWDLTRSAGGSSGGAAAAVSARLASVGQGSDGGGSIRIPASATGLVGIKPARGRVGVAPGIDGLGELSAVGPLARTVADAAAFLDVLAGARDSDPFGLPDHEPGSFLAAARRPPRRLRVGRFSQPMIVETDVHRDCLAAWESASDLLRDLGHRVDDIPRPLGPDVVGSFEAVWATGTAAIELTPQEEAQILPLTRWLREWGRTISSVELVRAIATMRRAARAAVEATAEYDILLTPTLAQPPALVGGLRDDADPAGDFAAQKSFTPYTSPFNVTGQPAMSVPLHMTGAGLPVGVQLVGRPREEWTMISLAGELEQAVEWHKRRPPIG